MYSNSVLESDIKEAKDQARVDSYIKKIENISNNIELTDIFTEILSDDEVAFLLTRISQNSIFLKYFPEFYEENIYGESVINCQQNNMYHNYGVFLHTLIAVANVGNLKNTSGDWQRKILKWTMLLHDIGKPYVKFIKEDSTDSFVGHEERSCELAINILERFNFSVEEKTIILKLIKYHDTFLNEGEAIFENLKFLAEELENKKELFNLLIDVKESDAKAKTEEVYKKFLVTKKKYIDFYNKYFTIEDEDIHEDIIVNTPKEEILENIVDLNVNKVSKIEKVSDIEYDNIIESILKKQNISVLYQPIIDIERKKVEFYEAFSKIEYSKAIDMKDFLKYIKELSSYNKIQQMLFINILEKFEDIKIKDINVVSANIDFDSYMKYINKPRIYDVMNRITLIMEASNYEKDNYGDFNEKIKKIKAKNGKVLIDNFGKGIMGTSELKMLDFDYVKPSIEIINNLENKENIELLKEILKICEAKDAKLVAFGVETKEQYLKLKEFGIRYFQGYFFDYPSYNITTLSQDIIKKI